ncbi:GNAT family N-acetyltransferase [Candidatus Woesearchaeota archaeon]|nr:GNAT family N-acetyltransferase [Candidatus Woesearchaeota archaeon]
MKIVIRKAKPADAAAVNTMHEETIRTVNKKDYTPQQINVWAGRFTIEKRLEAWKKNRCYVATISKMIVGFGDFRGKEVMGLYVHKKYLGKGVGSKLLERIEIEARKQGIKVLFCTSTITAKEFYQKMGFHVMRKTVHRFKDQDLLVYRMKKVLQ